MRIIKNLPSRAILYRVEKILDNYRYRFYCLPNSFRCWVMLVHNSMPNVPLGVFKRVYLPG